MRSPVPVQGKRNAASRLGQALGQLAWASMHPSEGEGPLPILSRRATQRKHRKTDDAASADDVSSQASASSMTEQRHSKVSLTWSWEASDASSPICHSFCADHDNLQAGPVT